MDFRGIHQEYKLPTFNRRFIPPEQFEEQIVSFGLKGLEIGRSVEDRPIRVFRFGAGPTKVILWSQMHGNESTGTRVFLDIFNFFINDRERQKELISNLSLYFIPMLNPDGAEIYKRANAKGVDLNRDFLKPKSPEMKAFIKYIEQIKPDWAFNMHDQRNIFNVAGGFKPATISLLAPAVDEKRSMTPERKDAMKLAGVMFEELQKDYPEYLSRFTDDFYPLASGDNLQAQGVRTVTVESGGFPNDPMREVGRVTTFVSLLRALQVLDSGELEERDTSLYESIPLAEMKLCDILMWTEDKSYCYAFAEDRYMDNGQLKVEFELVDQGELKDIRGYREFVAIEPIDFKNGIHLNMDDISDVSDLIIDRGVNAAEKANQSN